MGPSLGGVNMVPSRPPAARTTRMGIDVEVTPGDGPMAGRLQHGSARPAAPQPTDLEPTTARPNGLSEAGIRRTVDEINRSQAVEKATPKSMGCK